MTGQVRPVTSWMISAGPDARATGANADAYVSAGATRIRAVGACPSRLLLPVPRFRSPRRSPSSLLFLLSTQCRVSIRTSLARYNPHTNEPGLVVSFAVVALGRGVLRETAGKRDATLYSCIGTGAAGKMHGLEEEKKERTVEGEGTSALHYAEAHTKLYRGESNLSDVALIGDFHADDARC